MPVEPLFPLFPFNPVDPLKPVGPIGPVSPLAPGEPTAPTSPFSPLTPRGPVGPSFPLTPWAPVSPLGPRGPVFSGAPLSPLYPGYPGAPGTPRVPCWPVWQILSVVAHAFVIFLSISWRICCKDITPGVGATFLLVDPDLQRVLRFLEKWLKMQNRNWLIESDRKLLYFYYGCCFTIGASLLVCLCVCMCFFTLNSLLAHRIFRISSFVCNFRISFFFHCVVKLMHVLPFPVFLFQPGNLL